MKSQTLITILLIGLAFAGLMIWGYSKNGNDSASAQGVVSDGSKTTLTTSETTYDFGTISMKDGDVSKDFVFTNSSDREVVIRGLETSCMCTTAFLIGTNGAIKGPFGMAGMGGKTTTKESVGPGESRTLRVVYDPKAHGPAGVGRIDRFVTVTDASGGAMRFEIKALVTP